MTSKEKFSIIHSRVKSYVSNTYIKLNASLLSSAIANRYYDRPKERLSSFRIPVKIKLSIVISLILGVIILILSIIILNRQKKHLYMQTVMTGKINLNYFTNNSRIPLLEDNILRLNTLIKESTTVKGLLYAIITDRKNVIKAHSDYTKIGTGLHMFDNMEKWTKEGHTVYFSYTSQEDVRILNLSRSVMFKDKVLGKVHVGISLDFIKQQIHREGIFILIVSLIVITLGIGMATLFGIGFSRPISQLVFATEEISKGNFHHRIDKILNNELGDLARAFNYMSQELWTKSLMQESFGRYVSPEVLNMILANPEDSWLKGIRSNATILLTDIRGFTSFSATHEPEEVVETLNEYFEIATHFILEYGGYVDKLIGDAVLGVFGVPAPLADHAERAVRAAIGMQKELQRVGKNGNPLLSKVGIGINSGVVVSGNIGSRIKMEYTVIGDVVNLTHRLCSMAGPGEIIISKSIYHTTQHITLAKKLLPQKIKGKSDLIETFQLLDIKENLLNL